MPFSQVIYSARWGTRPLHPFLRTVHGLWLDYLLTRGVCCANGGLLKLGNCFFFSLTAGLTINRHLCPSCSAWYEFAEQLSLWKIILKDRFTKDLKNNLCFSSGRIREEAQMERNRFIFIQLAVITTSSPVYLSDGTWGSGLMLHQEKFGMDIRKNSSLRGWSGSPVHWSQPQHCHMI